jgi:hypothetical protein
VVSIGIRGNYTRERFAKALAKLQDWLEEHGDQFRPAGPPRYFAYNSPFVPGLLKFGEVQVPVRRIVSATVVDSAD